MGIEFASFLTLKGLIGLLTLTLMEIVLGIDNVIFISILTGKLPKEHQARARSIGLSLALIFRIGLLFGITWIISLKKELFNISGFALSGKDLILLGGGVFLLWKSVSEIMERFHVVDDESTEEIETKVMSVPAAVVQIIFLDIVFSFDSILAAVGISKELPVMVAAVIVAVAIMLAFSGVISDFVNRQPTIRMLALAFLVMIGVLLCCEALHIPGEHGIDKEYIYVAMGFALGVELLNLQAKRFQDESNRKLEKRRLAKEQAHLNEASHSNSTSH